MWVCTVPGKPKTKGNHKRVVRTKSGKTLLIGGEAALKAEADARSVIAARAPEQPLEGPLLVDITFVYAIPKSARAGKRRPAKLHEGDPCMRRVDRGNLLKLIEDAMEGLVYLDDSQIVGGDVRKVWGERDETRITVRQLEEERAAA